MRWLGFLIFHFPPTNANKRKARLDKHLLFDGGKGGGREGREGEAGGEGAGVLRGIKGYRGFQGGSLIKGKRLYI